MTVAVLQSNYLPWKGYFDLIDACDTFVLYDIVQYTKNDWRNRNRIATKNGVQWLTVPVRSQRLAQRIDEVEVADQRWAAKHWKTLQGTYARAPHFADYAAEFESLYESLDTVLLSEINTRFIKLICAMLGIDTRILSSADFDLPADRNERLVAICNALGESTYVSGPAAKSYLDVELFAAAGIDVRWVEYGSYPEYPQFGTEFEHAVSIVDLLFQTGPAANDYRRCLRLV